jgi:hypothetical protein
MIDPITGAIVAGVLGKVVNDFRQSDKLSSQASEKNLKSMNQIEEARAAQRLKQEEARQAMIRLGNRKKGILSSSMKKFLGVYEQLKKINFVVTDGIAELSNLPSTLTEELSGQILYVSTHMTEKELISTFVFNSLIWGVAGGISTSIKKDSQRKLDMAQARAKQARAIAEQTTTIGLAYEAVFERANRITDVLTKLNLLFLKSLSNTQDIIEKNGTDKNNYSLQERESLAICINLAKAVKSIIDTPLLDESGKITIQSLKAIENGQNYLQKINCEMNQ